MPLNHEVLLIGAPSDAGAGQPGAHAGPGALRAAGLVRALQQAGRVVHDGGDLDGPPRPRQAAAGGYRHLAAVSAWCRLAHDAVLRALAQERLPLLLGGDHSLAIGSLSAVARHCHAASRPLRVLWFDAHADCNSRLTSPSANLHGMPLACLRGVGPATLLTLSGRMPALAPHSVRLVGVRSVDAGEAELAQALGLEIIAMATLRAQGADAVMTHALQGMTADAHLHVSLDVDFLDPGVAPGTDTAVAGGASLDEARRCLQHVAASGRLGSVDVVELDPARDPQQHTATGIVRLLATLLGPAQGPGAAGH